MSPHVFGAMDSPSFLADCHSFSCCHLCAKRKAYTVFFRKALLLISELLAATEEVTRLDFTEVDTAPRMMRPQARFPVACLDERPESLPGRSGRRVGHDSMESCSRRSARLLLLWRSGTNAGDLTLSSSSAGPRSIGQAVQ